MILAAEQAHSQRADAKSTVNKNRLPPSREGQIGSSWQAPDMQAISVSLIVQPPPDGKLRFRVSGLDQRHALASFSGSQRVHLLRDVILPPPKTRLLQPIWVCGKMLSQRRLYWRSRRCH